MGATELNRTDTAQTARATGLRGVVLDYGEVVARRPASAKLERMAAAVGLDTPTFADRYDQERRPYDRGDLSPRDYWSKVVPGTIELHAELLGKLRQWDVEMWSDTNAVMIEWLAQLRAAGFKTALLSNMHCDMVVRVRRELEWFEQLDFAVLSSEVRLAKPERAIYERCLAGLALEPSEVLFIDDREVNVQGAIGAGWKALCFRSLEWLHHDLTRMSFPVLPALQ